ncbi:hypothetical protein PHYBLDRAFT_138636 [Phycomyces blakesleeanus NRRL 1555(-)]|uniref:Uncharacterized protein n=1 Tax=Phycomyces blakesleeanus (strain ATCC 8743b / DSM 1359 / FGSC 10004 / NBRC 33097 / NRRL 1555) TaxID=763407 RepID=A0A162V9U5_PHYB8|nr:hypothetical protein PHYBLDRAFT_138636 [Phycomyces blakesleeanus NRRL 1555(-)]OAD81092.1 hypothetical protein PHYBLDRAFT_138636 [Phycomyces blakesleeanus NRRL 1555(-)]|eukprot:XP_018299132.1 hypothetical protein PHYBLDRAFT_138636 [Phycomyces blakesleeanus NRRL 1555(-)]
MSAPVYRFPPPKYNAIVFFIPLANKVLDSEHEFLSGLGISQLSLSPMFCPDWASLDSTHCSSLLYVPPEVPKELKAETLSDTTPSKVVWLSFVCGFLIVDIFVSYSKQKMNTNTSATRISGSDSDISATDYIDIAQDFVALAPSLQERNQSLFNSADQASLDEVHGREMERNQDVITSTDMAFLNAVHDQDIGRAEENDFEAFMALRSVHSISNSVDVKFNNDYTETNEAEYNDSDNSNDYSYESVHGYLHIRNPVNINTLPIKSDFVTKNVNQESYVPFYESNTYAEAATLELFSMFVENNVSCNVFDKCIKILTIILAATNVLLSYYKMDKILKDEYTVHTATYDICMKGCIRFCDVKASNLIDEKEQCSHCGSQWFRRERDTLVPVQTFKVVHLSQ